MVAVRENPLPDILMMEQVHSGEVSSSGSLAWHMWGFVSQNQCLELSMERC